MGRFPSGQREQTVNLPLLASVVRIHPCPHLAGMAELADAHDSGSCVRTYLQVQVLFPARGVLDFQGLFPFVLLPYYYRDFRLLSGSLFFVLAKMVFFAISLHGFPCAAFRRLTITDAEQTKSFPAIQEGFGQGVEFYIFFQPTA